MESFFLVIVIKLIIKIIEFWPIFVPFSILLIFTASAVLNSVALGVFGLDASFSTNDSGGSNMDPNYIWVTAIMS